METSSKSSLLCVIYMLESLTKKPLKLKRKVNILSEKELYVCFWVWNVLKKSFWNWRKKVEISSKSSFLCLIQMLESLTKKPLKLKRKLNILSEKELSFPILNDSALLLKKKNGPPLRWSISKNGSPFLLKKKNGPPLKVVHFKILDFRRWSILKNGSPLRWSILKMDHLWLGPFWKMDHLVNFEKKKMDHLLRKMDHLFYSGGSQRWSIFWKWTTSRWFIFKMDQLKRGPFFKMDQLKGGPFFFSAQKMVHFSKMDHLERERWSILHKWTTLRWSIFQNGPPCFFFWKHFTGRSNHFLVVPFTPSV